MKKVVIDGIQYGVRDDEVLVLGFGKNEFVANVVIPAEVQQKPVRQIYKGAFQGTNIETVLIPTTIHYIHNNAFLCCRNLTSVSDYVVNQVSGIVYPWMHIYDNAFAECENLRTVSLQKEVGYVTECAFSGCRKLGSLNTTFGTVRKNAFYGCQSLTEICFGKHGHIANQSIENSAIKKIIAYGKLSYTQLILNYIRKQQIKICCPATSNLIDLAYVGCDVEII